MDGISFLRSLGGGGAYSREPEWLDVLVYAEENHPGKGQAARWLADELDVNVRSAQRYLQLGQQPTLYARDAAEGLRQRVREEWADADEADARQQVSDLLRLIRHVDPGFITVSEISDPNAPDSTRASVGEVDVDLSAVADAWDDEDDQAAADALSDAIIQAYGDKGGVDELHDNLMIVDYRDGIDWR